MLYRSTPDAHTTADVDYRWKGGKSQGVEIVSKEMAQFDFVGAKTTTKANTNSKGKTIQMEKMRSVSSSRSVGRRLKSCRTTSDERGLVERKGQDERGLEKKEGRSFLRPLCFLYQTPLVALLRSRPLFSSSDWPRTWKRLKKWLSWNLSGCFYALKEFPSPIN